MQALLILLLLLLTAEAMTGSPLDSALLLIVCVLHTLYWRHRTEKERRELRATHARLALQIALQRFRTSQSESQQEDPAPPTQSAGALPEKSWPVPHEETA